MVANFLPGGIVVASPANGTEVIYAYPNGTQILQNDYLFMWQRDAGLTMRSLMKFGGDGPAVQAYVAEYAHNLHTMWSVTDPNKDCWPHTDGWCDILGEPKFFINGSVYNKGWGRAQNDGPAINAMVLMDMLDRFTVDATVEANAKSDIIRALHYVGQLVSDSTVDPWEMLYGQHYFDQAIMQLSFLKGHRMATQKNWTKDTDNYPNFATMLSIMVQSHWNASAGALRETLARPWVNWVGPKCLSSGVVGSSMDGPCELDIATILGALYSYDPAFDGEYPELMKPWSSEMLATAEYLIESMAPTYQVNQEDDANGIPGLLLGRYPGDEYSGVIMGPPGAPPVCSGFNCGNPWFVATYGMAELFYTAARAGALGLLKEDALNRNLFNRVEQLAGLQEGGERSSSWIWSSFLGAGDALVKRALHHAGEGMHMSEQIYRGNDKMPPLTVGQMVGVRDLTWSYTSLLDALVARREAEKAKP
eukprot:SRR837773.14551.p2 GENE.SRR837773.14551~~SRR837773.14551.p2  ORF type:complete len:536 (-),score=130.72 SRR837773.14551:69-1499(-)